MMCYRDITYCGFYEDCANGGPCPRALTQEVLNYAEKYGFWISQFIHKPRCFAEKGERKDG